MVDLGSRQSRPSECGGVRRRLGLAIVTETYPPEVNGVAQTISKVVEGLRDVGHEITLVRPEQKQMVSNTRVREILVRGIPIPRYGQLRMGLPAVNRLLRLWREERPDVVHIVTEGPLGVSALVAARRLGIPICSEFRTNFHSYCAHYGVGWLASPIIGYLRWFHNRTECTMVPTRALAADLRGRGFERLRVVARGVDTRLFDPRKRCDELRRTWGAQTDTPVLIYVGRLANEKNLPVLLAAFRRIQRTRTDSKLVLVGDGPARAELASRCPEAIFVGVRKGEDLARHYASGDLFLFPSLTETFGNVTAEAMASGLAVVAFDHAAAGELIKHGHNGLLARPGDEVEFTDRALDVVGRIEGMSRLRSEARRTACGLEWARIIDEIERAYAFVGMPKASGVPAELAPARSV